MWKEWTNKIKTFAEDITSPDYDEEGRRAGSGSAGDLGQEREDEDALHDAQDLSTGVRPAAGYGGNRGIVTDLSNDGRGPGGANARGLPVLETPVRRLDSQYDDMPLERWRSMQSMESVPYAQPASPAPAPSAAAHAADASHSAGDRDGSFDSVSLRRQQHPQQQPAAAAASPSVSSHALPPAHGASAAERRGPPQAMVTPRPAPATAQPAPASASASAPVDSVDAKRVAALEAEKAQLMRDINAYQAEVRVAHEQTVAYYEAKLREAAASSSASVTAAERASSAAAAAAAAAAAEENEESKQEIVALRAALQAAATELQTAQATRHHVETRVSELETQTALLQSSLAAAQEKVEAAASAPLPAPDADVVQQQEQLRRQTEEAQEVQARLQQEVQEKAAQLSAQAAQLAAAEQARRSLEAQLHEAQAGLMESRSSGRERSAAAAAQTEELQQLHDDVDRLTGELNAEQQRTTTVEAQRVAAEQETQTLATQLAEEKRKVAQATARVEALKTSQAAAAAPPAPRVDPSAQEQLLDKLSHAEAERDVLQQEVRRLTEAAAQLQRTIDTQEKEHQAALAVAHRELAEREAALRAKLTDAEARLGDSRGALEVEVRELHVQLQVTQKQVQAMAADKAAVQAACSAAETQAASAEQRCRTAQAAAAAAQQQLQQQAQQAADAASERARQLERDERQRASEAERRRTGAEVSVAALTQVKKELEHKLQTLETTAEQLRSMTVDTLVRLGVDLKQVLQDSQRHGGAGAAASAATAPSATAHHGGRHRGRGDHDGGREDAPSSDEEAGEDEEEASADSRSSSNDGDDTSADRHRDVPLVQLFSLLVAECVQQHSIVVRAERVQREWEQTYEQARHVNEALNQQLADAWATIGKLREEVSVREESARQMQSRVGSGDARLVEVQEQLTSALHEVQTLREERESWVSRLQLAQSGAEGQAQAMAALEEELQALQTLLQAKEEELQTSMQSAENLQLVLDRFQENKRNEVEALTLESQLETEEVKKQLEATRRTTERHASELAAVREGFERQLALKDAEVTTMHRKLAEVRKALEKTASRHMDGGETSIDKRVVSQLLAKYIHAFIGQRREAEDMLKVMSGLLDWDEATQELAGLLPGPNNPQPPGGAGAAAGGGGQRRGLFGWRRGNTQPTDRAPSIVAGSGPAPGASSSSSGGGGGGAPPGKSGLASMWVEFLMKESEGRAGSAEAAPASPLASSSTSTPAGTEQRATRSVGCSSPPAQPPTSKGGPAV